MAKGRRNSLIYNSILKPGELLEILVEVLVRKGSYIEALDTISELVRVKDRLPLKESIYVGAFISGYVAECLSHCRVEDDDDTNDTMIDKIDTLDSALFDLVSAVNNVSRMEQYFLLGRIPQVRL